jgi:hypothetical protein
VLQKNEDSTENRVASETSDPLMQARMKYHLPNFYDFLDALSDVSQAFKNFTQVYSDQVQRLHT